MTALTRPRTSTAFTYRDHGYSLDINAEFEYDGGWISTDCEVLDVDGYEVSTELDKVFIKVGMDSQLVSILDEIKRQAGEKI